MNEINFSTVWKLKQDLYCFCYKKQTFEGLRNIFLFSPTQKKRKIKKKKKLKHCIFSQNTSI